MYIVFKISHRLIAIMNGHLRTFRKYHYYQITSGALGACAEDATYRVKRERWNWGAPGNVIPTS